MDAAFKELREMSMDVQRVSLRVSRALIWSLIYSALYHQMAWLEAPAYQGGWVAVLVRVIVAWACFGIAGMLARRGGYPYLGGLLLSVAPTLIPLAFLLRTHSLPVVIYYLYLWWLRCHLSEIIH